MSVSRSANTNHDEIIQRINAAIEMLERANVSEDESRRHQTAHRGRAALGLSIVLTLLSATGVFLYLMLNSRNPKYYEYADKIDLLTKKEEALTSVMSSIRAQNFSTHSVTDNCYRWHDPSNSSIIYDLDQIYPAWWSCIDERWNCNDGAWHPLAACRNLINYLFALTGEYFGVSSDLYDEQRKLERGFISPYETPYIVTMLALVVATVAVSWYLIFSYFDSRKDDKKILRHESDLVIRLLEEQLNEINELRDILKISPEITRVDSMISELKDKRSGLDISLSRNPVTMYGSALNPKADLPTLNERQPLLKKI